MKNKLTYKVGDKVQFDCWNHDTEKYMFGRGWVKEIDLDNGQIIIQTTRKLIWVEISGVNPINQNKN